MDANGSASDATAGEVSGTRVPNLLMRLEELAQMSVDAARVGDWLNLFLTAAGMDQIVEDYLHPNPLRMAQVSELLRGRGNRRLARLATGCCGIARVLRHSRNARRIGAWRRDLSHLVTATAAVLANGPSSEDGTAELVTLAARLEAGVTRLPRNLRHELVRLPAGLHAFDQQPGDLRRLVERFAVRWGDRQRPLLVTGVRTTGSYFAPLCATFLRSHGYRDVTALTVRPGQPLSARERRAVRVVGASGGIVLLVDDPPVTGGALASSARMLGRLGIPDSSIVVLTGAFGDRKEPPPLLAKYESVALLDDEWAIHSRMTPGAARDALSELVGPSITIQHVEQIALAEESGRRGHRRALFRVRLEDEEGVRDQRVLVEGVGLGYFGEHTVAVASRLAAYVPEVYGVRDGLLFRAWLDERDRAPDRPATDDGLAASVAAYVNERRKALPVDSDRSLQRGGDKPVWEVVAALLARPFARAWPVARLAFADRAARFLLRPAVTSVVDGKTARSEWFAAPAGGSFLKVGFADRSFWNFGLSCFDAVFDLAGVDAGRFDKTFAAELRAGYEQHSGEPVDPERWLLYQVAHLWGRRRTHPDEEPELRRRLSRAVQGYFAEVLLDDVATDGEGPLCALDLDGVVETEALGFPATSLAGALALRALRCHGFRPVLVSGRSGGEIAERCLSYGLSGGVGEYGAVVYDAKSGIERSLLSPDEAELLGSVRDAVSAEETVVIDRDYRRSVRGYRLDEAGRRCDLGPGTIDMVVERGRIRAIHGEGQTDFMVTRIDKGNGLLELARTLGEAQVALAVGDTVSDLPMFALAERALAPASADEAVRESGVEILRAPYQSGLALAAARLIGHYPGACAVCRPLPFSPRTKLLLDILSAQARGRLGIARALLRLTWRARRW